MASSASDLKAGTAEDLGTSVGILLSLLGQDTTRRLRDALAVHGLKPRQFRILSLLGARGPIGQRALGEALAMDHSILVTMLNPLEASGLIARKRSSADRRRHVVTITPAGKRRLASAAQAHCDAEDDLFASLTPHQRTQLRSLLVALRTANNTEFADDDCQ